MVVHILYIDRKLFPKNRRDRPSPDVACVAGGLVGARSKFLAAQPRESGPIALHFTPEPASQATPGAAEISIFHLNGPTVGFLQQNKKIHSSI